MKQYQVQQLSNQIYGLLKGTKSQPERARTITQYFLCEHCNGAGYFKDKHDNFGTECTCCKGEKVIGLEFSVKQINTVPRFAIIKE